MALDFPTSPTNGQKFPASPIVGIPTYTWDGEKWTTIGGSLGSGGAATALPLIDATPAVVGIASKYAREDHVHPTDTSRAAASALPVAATAAEYVANSAQTKMLTSGATWGAATAQGITDGATITLNLSLGLDWVGSIGAGRTMGNPTGGKPGQKGLIFLIGGSITSWGNKWFFPGTIKPTSTGGVDIISYVVGGDSTSMYCTFAGNVG